MALEVAQQSPRRPAAIQHYNQALAYYQQGRLDDAIREFQAALRVEPRNAAICTGLGWAYERQGHRHQAILEWQRAARAGSPMARQALAGAGVGLERAQLTPPRAWFRFSAAVMVLVVGLFWGLMPAWSPLAGWGLSQFSSQFSLVFPTAAPTNLIAFVSTRNGSKDIYVMNVDGSNQRRLTIYSAAADEPAWSPNRQHLAFVSGTGANRAIYVMDADGSNQRHLTNPTGNNYDADPAWSPDGQLIAFAGYRNGNYGIYVMMADGSNQRGLIANRNTNHDPAWSPDGKQIAFGGNNSIYVMNADGSGLRTLVSNSGQNMRPAWSPDGRYIAFTSTLGTSSSIYIMNADGSSLHRLIDNVLAANKPAWSPDGKRIAFATNRDRNNEIYVMDVDGSNVRRLTNNSAADTAPAWQSALAKVVAQAVTPQSPTQRVVTAAPRPTLPPVVEVTRAPTVVAVVEATEEVVPVRALSTLVSLIAFSSNRDGNAEIYVMNADGSYLRRLTNNSYDDVAPAWSPNGMQIAFEANPGGSLQIFVMNEDGSNVRRLTNSDANYIPTWSPDGRQIAFTSCGASNCHLYVVNADGSNLRRLTGESESTNEWSAAWSPDGRQIAYSVDSGTSQYINVMNADGTNAHYLVGIDGDPLRLAWSPDGTRITFETGMNNIWKIYVVNADGTNLRCLTTSGNQDSDPNWLMDSQHIVFASKRGGSTDYQIYVMDVAGANVRRLTNGPGANYSPVGEWVVAVAVAAQPTWTPFIAAATAEAPIAPPTEVPPTRVLPTRVPPTNPPPTKVPPTRVPPTATPFLLTGAGTCVPDQGTIIFMIRNSGQSQITTEYMVNDPTGARGQVDILRLAAGDTSTIVVNMNGMSGTYTLTVPIPPLRIEVACQAPTRVPPTKVPPTKIPPTPVPPTKIPPTKASGLSSLAVEAACASDQRTTTFTIKNNSAAMASDTVYMVTDSSATMQKAGAFRLAAGESTAITVDMSGVNGVLTLYVPDYQIKVAATCAAPPPTNTPLPTNTPTPALIGMGLCSPGQGAAFVITNNGSDMNAQEGYVVKDEAGNVVATGAIMLKSGESRSISVRGVSGKVTLSVLGAGLSVETVCASPTSTPMLVASGSCQTNGQLLVGTDASYPPFENVNTATNKIEGFDIDLLDAIGAKLGFTPVYQNAPFDTIFTNLAAGQLDMVISAATITQERSKAVSFGNPYFVAGQSITIREADAAAIKTATDLIGKKIGVLLGTTGAEAAKGIKDAAIYVFQTAPEAFRVLANKDVDAVISDNFVAYTIVQSRADLNLVVLGEPISPEYYGIVVRKECPQLLVTLNDGLTAVISEGTYANIYDKWMGSKPSKEFQAGGTGIRFNPQSGMQTPAGTSTPVLAAAAPTGLIAFSFKQGSVGSIYVMNSDGTNLHRLTNSNYDEFGAAWSPDGRQIAFFSNAEGHYQLHVVNVDGSDLRRLTNNPDPNAIEFSAVWSPDGQQIAFTSLQNGLMQVYVLNADGSNLHRLTNDTSNEGYAAWSPDGKQIALTSSREGNMHIYLMNADGSNLHRLTNTSGTEGVSAWSPDGKRIAFELDEKGTSENIQLFVVNIDGSNLQRLTNTNGRAVSPSWSPDGRYIAYVSNQDGLNRIYVMNADGSNPHRLTNADSEEYLPAWAPDPTRFKAQATLMPSATPGGPPKLNVSSNCMPNNEVSFVITNSGGAMSSPALYTLTDNTGVVLATNTLQLKAGSSMSISGLGNLTLNIPNYSISKRSNCLGEGQVGPTVAPGANAAATATGSKSTICAATASRAANVRSAPSVSGAIMDTLSSSQNIEVDGYTQGADGYIWYRRKDGLWVRSDLISVDVGCNIPLVQP